MHTGTRMERKQSKGAWQWVQAIPRCGVWSKKWYWGGSNSRQIICVFEVKSLIDWLMCVKMEEKGKVFIVVAYFPH